MTPLATPQGVVLLDQADHWHAWGDEGQLVQLRLDDMTPSHQRRTLAWLRDHAVQLHGQRKDVSVRLHRRGLLTDGEFADEQRYLDALDPAVWLDDQPLVRRLVQLIPRAPAPVRRRRYLPRRWWK